MSEVELVKGFKVNDQIVDMNNLDHYKITPIKSLIYDEVYDFKFGFAIVKRNRRFGAIDESGKEVIPCIYEDVTYPYEGLFLVRSAKNSRFGAFDLNGNQTIPFMYKDMYNFSEGLAAVFVDGYWGFIDKNNKMVIEPIYEEVGIFINGYAAVKNKKDYWGFINKEGELVIDYCFKEFKEFSQGLMAVKNPVNKKWGYINSNGEVIIPFKFDMANTFNDDKAIVSYLGQPYLIGLDGEVIHKLVNFKLELDEDQYVERNLDDSFLKNGNKYFFHKQNSDVDKSFEDIEYKLIKKDGKCGLINEFGEIVVEPIYDAIYEFNNGYAAVKLNGKWGFIDRHGFLLGAGVSIYDEKLKQYINYSHMTYADNTFKALSLESYFGIKENDEYIWFKKKQDRDLYLKENKQKEKSRGQLVLTNKKN